MFFNISVHFKILIHKQSNNGVWKNSALHKMPVLDSQAPQILGLMSSSLQQPFIIHLPSFSHCLYFSRNVLEYHFDHGYNTNVSDTKPDV